MDLRQSTEQTIRVGPLLAYRIDLPPTALYGKTLSWFWWRNLVKADNSVVNLINHTWSDAPSSNGIYLLTLTANDTNQLGSLEIYMVNEDTLIRPVYAQFNVISPNIWDAKYSNGCTIVDSQHAQKG